MYLYQTEDEEEAVRKAISLSLESYQQEQEKKKQSNTSSDKRRQLSNSRRPRSLFSPKGTKCRSTPFLSHESNYLPTTVSTSLSSKESEENAKSCRESQTTGRGMDASNSPATGNGRWLLQLDELFTDQNYKEKEQCSKSPHVWKGSGGARGTRKANSIANFGSKEEEELRNGVLAVLSSDQVTKKTEQRTKSSQVPLIDPRGRRKFNSVSKYRGREVDERKDGLHTEVSTIQISKETEESAKSHKVSMKGTGAASGASSVSGITKGNKGLRHEISPAQITKECEPCTKYNQLPPKRARRRIETSSKALALSMEKAIPLCLPNNFTWDPTTGKIQKTGDERCVLDPVPAAIKILENIKEPVSVVSIAGPYRDGKSYILGEVFGGKNVFSIGHSMDPETFGLWMWIVPEVFQV
ncbi:uncharacterized protein LOC111331435 isoform X2 [Stylophora pistillata]|nr:uncharacterized protein LOC111331435 isoform X2 [Stylophora pistillata]